MTSAPDCVARFIQEGIFIASPHLTARRLREKAPDLWPASGKGGGRHQPQVEPRHLTNFILAQAAHLPIDAADAVTALRDVAMTERELLRSDDKTAPYRSTTMIFGRVGDPLGWVLDTFIAAAADPDMRMAMEDIVAQEWTLTLCADPPFATASYRSRNDEIWTDVFGHRTAGNRARRLITLPFKVVLIAGELCQDSQTRSATLPGAALPKDQSPSAARTEESHFSKVDSIPRVRAATTHPPRGDHDGQRRGATVDAAAEATG